MIKQIRYNIINNTVSIYLLISLLFLFSFPLFSKPIQNNEVHLESADEYFDSLKVALDNELNDTLKIKILNKISWHLAISDVEKSIEYADSAIRLSEINFWKSGKATALNNIGEALRTKGSFKEALEKHKEALKIYQEINDELGIAKTESDIGIAYFNLADFSSSFRHFDDALEIYKYLDDKDGVLNVYSYIGVVFSNYEQHEKAIEYFENALIIAKSTNNQSKIATQLNNLGLTYVELKDYSKAINYYQRALEKFKILKDDFNYSIALGNLGIPQAELKQYSNAIDSYNESIRLATKLGDRYGVAHQYGNLGELYLQMAKDNNGDTFTSQTKDYIAKSIKNLKLSISEFGKLGALADQKDYLIILSDVYSLKSDYKNAFFSYRDARSLQDSIQSKENQKVIAGLEIKQELYNKEQEITILNQDREYQSMIKTAISILAILMLFIAGLILFFYKKKKNDNVLLQKNIELRQEVEDTLRINEKELTKHKNNLEELVGERTKELENEILDHQQTEEALKKAVERAEIANNAKSVFLANMSHELRTPLVGILGYSDLLTSIVEDKEAKEMAEGINRTGNRLLNTLSLVLDLARIESDKYEIEFSEVDIIKELEDTHLNFKAMAEKKNLDLKLEVHADEFIFSTDASMIKVILDNLVNNALKFTSEGEVTIMSDVDYMNGESRLILKVIDSGVGIKEKDLPLIFEEFKQLSEGFTKDFQGSGLGLSITKKFVGLLGGNINVYSSPGIGSTFTINFPIEVKAVA